MNYLYQDPNDPANIRGPVSVTELERLKAGGKLHESSQVCAEGTQVWKKLGDVVVGGPKVFPVPPPIAPPPRVAPPPPPPTAAPAPPSSAAAPTEKSKTSATKGCLGCLGVIVGILVLLGIIGAIVGPSDSTKTGSSSSGSSSSGWGSPLEGKLVGVYECANPMWALQLKSGGDYVMQALDSGSTWRGTWSASGSSGLLEGTSPSKATMSISIQSDGAIVIDKYGYTFVRTR